MNRKDMRVIRRKRAMRSLLRSIIIIMIVLVVIVGADYLESHHALRVDNSFNGITSQSLISQRVLEDLKDDVHAYAVFSRGQEDRNLIGLLERIAAYSPHFTFSVENLAANPNLTRTISSDLGDEDVTTDSVILYSKVNDRTKVLTGANFLQQGYDAQQDAVYVAGLNYEKAVVEAIVYVSQARVPRVQILTGHGELSDSQIAPLTDLLAQFHYVAERTELLAGAELDTSSPLLILSPQKDFTEAEIFRLEAFARAGGSMLITDDFSSAPPMPVYETFLRTYGIVRRPGLVVAQQASMAYPDMPAVLVPKMHSTEPTAALVSAGQTSLVLAGAVSFITPEQQRSDLILQTVLSSGDAYVRNASDLDATIDQQPEDETGDFALALLADRAFEDGTHSRAFIIGNSGLFTDSWMQANTYSAEFFLNTLNYLDPGDPIDLPIGPKDAMRKPLSLPQNGWTVALIALPPLAVLVLAMMVLLPRRRL